MGKYGMLHKTYLKENKPMLYDRRCWRASWTGI